MKLVIAALLALAISSEASYPYALPEPVIPAPVYGVPEESKPVVVVPATVYGVPEEPQPAVVAPIKTEYSYTLSSLPVPTTPAEIHIPSGVTSQVEGSLAPVAIPQTYFPSLYHGLPNYGASYGLPSPAAYGFGLSGISAVQHVLPQYDIRPLEYSYGYNAPLEHPLLYGAAAPAGLVSSGLSSGVVAVSAPVESGYSTTTVISGPAHVPAIVQEAHEVEEPFIFNYEYEIPTQVVAEKVVVPEFTKPIIPHSTYGLPY